MITLIAQGLAFDEYPAFALYRNKPNPLSGIKRGVMSDYLWAEAQFLLLVYLRRLDNDHSARFRTPSKTAPYRIRYKTASSSHEQETSQVADMLCKPSICTVSLGRCSAGHSLQHKLDVAKKYGFQAIELFFEDLTDLTKPMPGGDQPSNQLAAAAAIRKLCDDRELSILCLQPFMHYEGLIDRELHQKKIKDAKFWVHLAHILGTDMILLPSSFLSPSELSTDRDMMIRDMVEIADVGLEATPIIRFAYEALCWGTRVDTWEASWDVVQRVSRSNFGICLDTFNIAGRIYADPAIPSGRTENCNEAIEASLREMIASVDPQKLFLVQVADAEKLAQALDNNHPFYSQEQPPRMSWSRNARLFYGENDRGGYLPIKRILDVIIHDIGYQGWLSFEVFHRILLENRRRIPETMARRAERSWRRMERDLALGRPTADYKTQALL
ncbi:hypothetical protein Trco_007700 [Trichoderma cornu-damae]|uniref:Xylose isomerase-like TIM barrel domain-containing protein n=1 Tax=Trichoderma cornu-damae TaxID=654480 RepID=A0A9P8TUK3_9HYPO|nr:hypothetical protein Trco_007700 [Trichoderma cornu-damae]